MERSYIAIDIETTGLNTKQDRIIEVGAIRVIDGEETERFSSFVNPGRTLPERITELTGIRDDMLKDAPDIGEVIRRIAEFAGEFPLLGHNILFDYSFLKRAAINWGGISSWEKTGIDTLKIARVLMPEEEKKNLLAACLYFRVAMGTVHRAEEDARAASQLYLAMCSLYGDKRPEVFSAKPLIYRVKKEQPATKRQKERLHDLIKYHRINVSLQIEDLTRNEASRLTDQILSRYGKI